MRAAVALLCTLGLFGFPLGVLAHPHLDEEEGGDDLQIHIAQMLREIGRPCRNVVEIEQTATHSIITCEVDREGVTAPVVYTVAKPN